MRIDANPERKGQWLLTESQVFPLMKGVSESLAGRMSILELNTLNAHELRHESLSFIRDP